MIQASRVVLDLAIGNIIDDDDMVDERTLQEDSCDMLQDFLGTVD